MKIEGLREEERKRGGWSERGREGRETEKEFGVILEEDIILITIY